MVDSQAIERRTLEQKDRAELAAIVEAMGGKAGSRMKKADLVDQVLRLAGVVEDGPAPAAADAGQLPLEAPAPPTSPDAAPDAEPRPEDERDGDDRHRPRHQAQETTPRDQGRGRTQGGASPRDQDQDQQRDQVRGRLQDGEPPQDQQRDQPRGGGDQAKGQGGDQAQGQGGDQGEGHDGEGGTGRRRRRRGRNRDAAAGQPGQPGSGAAAAANGQPSPPQQGEGDPLDAEPVEVDGYLDLRDEGYGFLRVSGYLPSKEDVYVSVKQARQFGLRKGDHLAGASRMASRNEKNPALLRIDSVNGAAPDAARDRPRFDDLTPVHPAVRLDLGAAGEASQPIARLVDLLVPVGRGQRALLASPPRAGKTTALVQMATALEERHADAHVVVLLVDERPEEVTEVRRSLARAEVAASSFDRPADEHTAVAELTLERAKRMVEGGQDVVILLDGLTRLARAYSAAGTTAGRPTPGVVDAGALQMARRFFGSARNVEEGGSLTIVATVAVDTGSRTDEIVYEEVAGAANAELRFDRGLAARRTYPAIDVDASGTRQEEALLPAAHLPRVRALRRALPALAAEAGGVDPVEVLLDRLRSASSDDELLAPFGDA